MTVIADCTQGMNFVAAKLLLFMPEELAFWCLTVVCEDYFAESFTLDMAGSHVDSLILEELCRGQASAAAPSEVDSDSKKDLGGGVAAVALPGCPQLVQRCADMGVSVSLLSAQWFLCLYVDVLPTASTLRVWDLLFLDGAGVIFAVALSIFQTHGPKLLEATAEEEQRADLNGLVQTLREANHGLVTWSTGDLSGSR